MRPLVRGSREKSGLVGLSFLIYFDGCMLLM